MSNHAPEGQRVETVPYRLGPKKGAGRGEPLIDVSDVEAFARDFGAQQRGKWIEVEQIGGFCVLIRREVLHRIKTALAQWTDLSLFDTDIVGSKARQVGFQLVVCRDLFIHHFGTLIVQHSLAVAYWFCLE
jgi:GT2 family glycosyltransferase